MYEICNETDDRACNRDAATRGNRACEKEADQHHRKETRDLPGDGLCKKSDVAVHKMILL